MIKNSFYITEQEREHILKLTRVPNYRKPIKLREQYSAVIMDAPPEDLNTQQSQQGTSTGQPSTYFSKEKIDNLKKLGNFPQVDFNDKSVVQTATNQIINAIKKGYRSDIIRYYLDALNYAKPINPTFFDQQIKDINDEILLNTANYRNQTNDQDFDFKKNPDPSLIGTKYVEKLVGYYFGNSPFFAPKPFDAAEVISATRMDEKTCKNNLMAVMKFYDKRGETLDRERLKKYVSDFQLNQIKENLQACYYDRGNEEMKKRFFKIRNKSDKSFYDTLSRQLKKQLQKINSDLELGIEFPGEKPKVVTP